MTRLIELERARHLEVRKTVPVSDAGAAGFIDVLGVIADAAGQSPYEIRNSRRTLNAADLSSIMSLRQASEANYSIDPPRSHIFPLVSHHTYGGRALFGANRAILPRALSLLLVHDGLVVADPLEAVHRRLTNISEEAALQSLNTVVNELADVELLAGADLIRFTRMQPSLREANRSSVLSFFGLEPDLRVFTDFIEAASSVAEIPGSFGRYYSPQVQKLYSLFGIAIERPASLVEAVSQVRHLGAAVLEVSWQFSVAAELPACDLAFRGRAENSLARALVDSGMEADLGRGRHFERLSAGAVPNLDPDSLTAPDALAIRAEDAYASYRSAIRSALDKLETDRAAGIDFHRARGEFEERMRDQAMQLRTEVRRATFRERITEESLPLGLGIVGAALAAPAGPLAAAEIFLGVEVTALLWKWLTARNADRTSPVSFRYLSMLGRDAAGASATREA